MLNRAAVREHGTAAELEPAGDTPGHVSVAAFDNRDVRARLELAVEPVLVHDPAAADDPRLKVSAVVGERKHMLLRDLGKGGDHGAEAIAVRSARTAVFAFAATVMVEQPGYVLAVAGLLIFDLIDELGDWLNDHDGDPLLELCLRLLQAPTSDAVRAGELLTVVAHERVDGAVSFEILGAGTGRVWGTLGLDAVEWKSNAQKLEFLTAYVATLQIALNGLENSSYEDEQILGELWEFAER